MSFSYSFKSKKVLVTGGGQGLGRHLVQKLDEGEALVFTIENDPNLVEKLKIDLPNVTTIFGDISNWKETQEIVESLGPFDYLINNAATVGCHQKQDFVTTTEDACDAQLNANVKGFICVSQAVAKGMIKSAIQGSIVNVTGLIDRLAFPGISVYCATKAAQTMLTKSMALELGPYNIRVNSVCPTQFETENIQKTSPAALALIKRSVLPSRVQVRLDEVVDSILFLLSPLASMITGEDLVIDGGVTSN